MAEDLMRHVIRLKILEEIKSALNSRLIHSCKDILVTTVLNISGLDSISHIPHALALMLNFEIEL